MKKPLRYGYTTGACAAAAAKGAAEMLARQALVGEVSIHLPTGDIATFTLHGQIFSEAGASCFVIKDAGDDPDVTNGAEVWATVEIGARGERQENPPRPPFIEGGSKITITGGMGIGRVTKPGLAVPPGEWAINPVPRRMIDEAVRSVFSPFTLHPSPFTLNVSISIPDGEERAKKTLNRRLGIIGGLSILGTTGIVRPISAKAWSDTIDAALDVAKACGCETVVLSTGRTSEMAVQNLFNVQGSEFKVENLTSNIGNLHLPDEAFIMMGDHVAHALQACVMRGFTQPVIACQFAKLLKIACGHPNTHAAASDLDLAALRGWGEEAGFSSGIISLIANANSAREIAVESRFDPALADLVAKRAGEAASGHTPGIKAVFLLCGYDGKVVFNGGR